MKFLCGSCRTKYQISDQKVRGKVLTIRCKKCGAKVIVKESLQKQGGIAIAPLADEVKVKSKVAAQPAAQPAVQPAVEPAVRPAQGRAATGGALSSAFDVAMRAAPDDMPTAIAPTPANQADAGVEWYTATDGRQTGPFAYAELVNRIQAGMAQPRHYVWRDGFDSWKRIRDVPDLAQFISQRSKPPPPPPVAVDSGPKDNVVDLASARAEREQAPIVAAEEDGVVGDEEPTRQEPTLSPTHSPEPRLSEGEDREEQLDSVLNEALGIEGEGATTQASPEDAKSAPAELNAVMGSSAIFTSSGDPSHPGSVPEDLFDQVPRASSNEIVSRESTRFFVQAAGVNNQKSRNRMGLFAGLGAATIVVAFFGMWGAGIIEVNIPGVGNPFAREKVPEVEEELVDYEQLSPAEKAKLEGMLKGRKRPKRVKIRRRKSKGGSAKDTKIEYVSDDAPGKGGPRGSRAGAAGTVDLELGTEGGKTERTIREADLPGANVDDIPVVETGRLDEAMITQVVNSQRSAIGICYQRALKGNQKLNGKMEFQVTVQPDGAVSKAKVQTSKFQGTEIARCISEKIRHWKFPAFKGSAQKVVIPFFLQRGSY